MANKTRNYVVRLTWKESGNRAEPIIARTTGTTVQRAISKVVKDINDGNLEMGDWPSYIGDEDECRASDLMVVDVRCTEYDAKPAAVTK